MAVSKMVILLALLYKVKLITSEGINKTVFIQIKQVITPDTICSATVMYTAPPTPTMTTHKDSFLEATVTKTSINI